MAESHEARSQTQAKRRVWPQKREAVGRLAPEMAESHEARSQAQAKRRAWPQTRGAGRKALFAGAGGQLGVFRQTVAKIRFFKSPDGKSSGFDE